MRKLRLPTVEIYPVKREYGETSTAPKSAEAQQVVEMASSEKIYFIAIRDEAC